MVNRRKLAIAIRDMRNYIAAIGNGKSYAPPIGLAQSLHPTFPIAERLAIANRLLRHSRSIAYALRRKG